MFSGQFYLIRPDHQRLSLLANVELLRRILLGLLFLLLAGPVSGQTFDLANVQQRLYEVIDRTSPAIVEVQRRGAVFSGVIVSPSGFVLTAGHTIVPGERYTVILSDGRRLSGQALGASEQMRGERIDCGLIRVEHSEALPYVPLGDSSALKDDQPCLSISYPGGQRAGNQPIVRLGFVQRPNRPGRMLQTTALMEPGDSGGPLVDLSGKVIGIHSRIGTGMEQNYDMPVNTFKTYWDALNVVHQFSAAGGQVVPKLGFVGRDLPEGKGIAILSVVEGSIAQEIGLQADDVLTRIQDRNLTGLRDLQSHLLSAIELESEQVAIGIRRGPSDVEYLLSGKRLVLPRADRIPGLDEQSDSEASQTDSLMELSELMSTYRSRLTQELSTVCCKVTSYVDGQSVSIVATRIAGSPYLVSKSSQIGLVPFTGTTDQMTELQIVARDSRGDLILLKSPIKNAFGVELDKTSTTSPQLRQGQLLFSPLPHSRGLVSVVGSSLFTSPRQESRGYLGVVLRDAQTGEGVELVEVDDGPAQRAGLAVGDIITAFNSQPIRHRGEILSMLQTFDPNMPVLAKVRRNSQQFEATITLGARPNPSEHAADLMQKSLRRDGFPSIFCHDATLEPDKCGGPVVDLDGNWLGVNIARNSRVRTFAIPADVVAEFVRKYRDE